MARDFDGATDRLDWANIFDTMGQPMSVSMLVYPNAFDIDNHFLNIHVSGDGNWALIFWNAGQTLDDGALGVSIEASTFCYRHGTGAISEGSWQHIGFTWDGTITDATTIKVYQNGAEIGYTHANNGVAPQTAGVGSYALGGRIYNDDVNYNGRMQEVGIWDRVISDDEMAIMGNSYSPLFVPENLQFYSKLLRRTTEINLMSGALATHDGTTVIQHAPVINPAPPFFSFPGALPPGGVDIEIPAAALTLTGYAPTVEVTGNIDIEVPVAALALTGYAPTVTVSDNINIEIPVAALTLTGYVPAVATPTDIEIPVAALVLTGYAPTVGVGVTVEVPVAALALTGYAPAVTTTAHVDIEIPVAALMLTGYAPTVVGVGEAIGPDPVWDRYKREDFPELPHLPKREKTAEQERTERWNEDRRRIEEGQRLEAEAATLDEMAVERVDVYLEDEKTAEVKAGVRRRQSMINLEKGKIMGERAARKKEETDKIRRKNLAKGRRKLRRIRKKK